MFQVAEYEVSEEAGVALVCVEIESGELDGVVATVNLTTEEGSALETGDTMLSCTYSYVCIDLYKKALM